MDTIGVLKQRLLLMEKMLSNDGIEKRIEEVTDQTAELSK
jgi:hypothetical protein